MNDPKYFEMASKKSWEMYPLKKIVDFIHEKHETGEIKNILELGCGMAEILPYLPPSMHYTGIEPNAYCIEKLHQQYPHHTFLQGKAESIPSAPSSVDLVFATNVMEHVSDPEKVLSETLRVLRPGCCIIVYGPNYENPHAHIRAIRHYSILRTVIFSIRRYTDFMMRGLGCIPFRKLSDGYTDATGKYEIKDDDLRYLAGRYEIGAWLGRNGFKKVYSQKPAAFGTGMKGFLRWLLTQWPPFQNMWDTSMLIIYEKNPSTP